MPDSISGRSKTDDDLLHHLIEQDGGAQTPNEPADDLRTQGSLSPGYLSSSPGSPPMLSRSSSYIGSQSLQEDWELPLEKMTILDIFDNLALPTKLEQWQGALASQREKVKKQQDRLRMSGNTARDRAIAEWRRRVPSAEEQLAKYRRRVKKSIDVLNKRWSDMVTVSAKEKVSFISAVLNVFISGYLIGAAPEYFYIWFTAQLIYFMPIRFVKYKMLGLHYFLADLCYFVNFLCLISIWVFPDSKRLFISTYCLAYGNNAVAVAMWRNSLVFHSLDKVTSLFIHIMPPVTLHTMVHLTSNKRLQERFPAVYSIKYSPRGAPEHFELLGMLLWATVPYAIWQISYHFFITIRRADKIAAGRQTSFTWLRRSYSKTWIGKFVLSRPESLQEPSFMLIQYTYAILTILPCPIWFRFRWASAAFLMVVFVWSIWNGASYYMDVFGKRFQKELEQMKKDVAKWQNSPGGVEVEPLNGRTDLDGTIDPKNPDKRRSIDKIPLLDDLSKPDIRATGAELLNDSNGDVSLRNQRPASGEAP